RPLHQLVAEARRIGAGDLDAPIGVGLPLAEPAPAEISALGGAMEEMRSRLKALNRSREEYLFAVAHELQTPLAALGASAGMLADGRRVFQVLVNLLGNASKYGPEGEPIALSALRENGSVRIAVTDPGPGIPPEERATIFDRYYRSAAGRDAPGVGLGLAIVRAIVEAHGGEVGIAEAGERGVSVWFTLPAATEDPVQL